MKVCFLKNYTCHSYVVRVSLSVKSFVVTIHAQLISCRFHLGLLQVEDFHGFAITFTRRRNECGT